jgi:TPR repeat protein
MLNARFVLISLLLPTLWIHANGWAASNEHIKSQSTEEQLAQAIENGTSKDVEGLRESFARAPDFVERLQRMAELEGETLALMNTEALRLGAMGTALLDQFYGNLLGHQALKLYYERVGELEAAANHNRILNLLVDYIAEQGDGSREHPYAVFSAGEASTFLSFRDRQGVGSIYIPRADTPQPDSRESFDLAILIISARTSVEPGSEPLLSEYFDLSETFKAIRRRAMHENPEVVLEPINLIYDLARRGDLAAMTAIGTFVGLRDPAQFDRSRPWLEQATRRGNLLAQIALAELYTSKARSVSSEEAVPYVHMAIEQHLQAIAKGSTEAMVQLARIYLDEHFGINDTEKAVGLLEKAASLDTIPALQLLASFYYEGEYVEKDRQKAIALMHEAGELGNMRARMAYARMLVELDEDRDAFEEPALRWVTEAAEDDHVDAMMLLGEVYTKGEQVRKSLRRAKRWFKQASETSNDPQIINHVAWTLTVSDERRLRDERYALEIMDRMMNADPRARQNPAYIDTWAAAYAANGDFQRALELQQEALTQAEQTNADYLQTLRDHMESFQKQETIEEAVP